MSSKIATCIGCGCDDFNACVNTVSDMPCHWNRVDRKSGLGVCSECSEHIGRWDGGDREMSEAAKKAVTPAQSPALPEQKVECADSTKEVTLSCPLCKVSHLLGATSWVVNEHGYFLAGLTYGFKCSECEQPSTFTLVAL